MRLASTTILGVTGLAAGMLSCAEPDTGTVGQHLAIIAEPEPLPEPLPPEVLGNCPTVGTNVNQSLVVTAATHPGLAARFTFARVMQQIFDTGGGAPSQNKLTMYQAWMRTFASPECAAREVDPHGYGLQCPRTQEALLAGVDPYLATGQAPFTAIGLFNRFDLAPQDGQTCGEHRIVFAVPQTPASNLDRAFLIFEAALPNPQPELGIDGCYPVTRFWQSLSGMTVTARLDALEDFYFDGLVEPITGVFIGPVVTAQNYGFAIRPGTIDPIDPSPDPVPVPVETEAARVAGALALADVGGRAMTDHVGPDGAVLRYGGTGRFGQIRTNMFVNFAEWNLREFKTLLDCSDPVRRCILRFEHVPVAANPANELFLDSHVNSPKFQDTFLQQIDALAAATNPNQIGLNVELEHDEAESVSQRTDVFFSLPGHTSALFRTSIQRVLNDLGSPLTQDNILDRATTQTCAGCHRLSAGRNLGGFTWPSDAGFVHITETGFLSSALTTTFLPRRREILDDFIARRCDPSSVDPVPVDETRTVSGAPVGSSN